MTNLAEQNAVNYGIMWGMDERTEMFRKDRLQEEMDRLGYSVGKLEYLAGLGKNTLYNYLTGARKTPSPEILAKVVRKLNCSIDYLMNITDSRLPYADALMSDSSRQLLALFERLSGQRQRELVDMGETLLEFDRKDQKRMRRVIKENLQMLKMIETAGGEKALFEILDILADSSGFSRDELLRWFRSLGTEDESGEEGEDE